MTESLLLIIDVQAGLINEWTEHVPPRVSALQASFDQVSVTRYYNPQKSLRRRLVGESGFALGSPPTRLAFEPRNDATIIDKPGYSCVSDGFLDRLRGAHIARVHLCGIATEAGVLKCALDLFEAGIEPVVLAHACGSDHDPKLHAAALCLLRRLIGERQVIGS
jgi:nicotinamidase-related amidase